MGFRNSLSSVIFTPRMSKIDIKNLEEFSQMLGNMNKFDFDVFRFDEISQSKSMYYFTYELFANYNLFQIIDENVFKEFIMKIQEGYSRNNAYHNDIHAVDVLQSCLAIVENGDLAKVKF